MHLGPAGDEGLLEPARRDRARAAHATPTAAIWFHTGDIARMDEDGYTSIVQRKKDMIIVDGFNVYPSEVEAVLYTHPAVRLAAVIGVPDAYHGEVVKACVVLEGGRRPRQPTSSSRTARPSLAAVQGAAQVEMRDTLPMSAVGKILYRVLRDEHRGVDAIRRVMTNVDAGDRERMSGLEFFQQMIAGEMPPPPMVDAARHAARRSRGRPRRLHRRPPTKRFYNGMGVAHGGFAATLLDSALGCAINTTMPAGRRFTTLELKVNYTRPLTTRGRRSCAAKRTSSTSAAAPRRPKAASSTQPASSTRTARRRASSSSTARTLEP